MHTLKQTSSEDNLSINSKTASVNVVKISKDGKHVNNFITTRTAAVQQEANSDLNLPVQKKYLKRVSQQREEKLQRTQVLKHRSVQRKEVADMVDESLTMTDSVLQNVLQGLVNLVRKSEVIRFVTSLSATSINDSDIKPTIVVPEILSPEGEVIREAISDLYVAVVSNKDTETEESAILVLQQASFTDTDDSVLTRRVSNRVETEEQDKNDTLKLHPDTPADIVQIATKLFREVKGKRQKSKRKKKSRTKLCKLNVLCLLEIVKDTKIRLRGEGQVMVISNSNCVSLDTVSVRSMWGFVMAIQRSKKLASGGSTQYVNDKDKVTNNNGHGWTSIYIDDNTTIAQDENFLEEMETREKDSNNSETETDVENENEKKIKRPRRRSLMFSLKKILSKYDIDDITMSDVYGGLEEIYGDWIVGEQGFSKSEIDIFTMRAVGQVEPPSQIIDHLYLGSEYNATHKTEMIENKITLVVNVTEEVEDYFPEEFEYFKISLRDVPSSDLKPYFKKTIELMKERLNKGQGVLVHCQRGVSRSATIVIAYLMSTQGMSLKEALKHTKGKRNIVKPNAGFLKQLAEFESELQEKEDI